MRTSLITVLVLLSVAAAKPATKPAPKEWELKPDAPEDVRKLFYAQPAIKAAELGKFQDEIGITQEQIANYKRHGGHDQKTIAGFNKHIAELRKQMTEAKKANTGWAYPLAKGTAKGTIGH